MSEQGVVIMARKTSTYLCSVDSWAYPQACDTHAISNKHKCYISSNYCTRIP